MTSLCIRITLFENGLAPVTVEPDSFFIFFMLRESDAVFYFVQNKPNPSIKKEKAPVKQKGKRKLKNEEEININNY